MTWRTDVPSKPGWTAESIRKAAIDKQVAAGQQARGEQALPTVRDVDGRRRVLSADEARAKMIEDQERRGRGC